MRATLSGVNRPKQEIKSNNLVEKPAHVNFFQQACKQQNRCHDHHHATTLRRDDTKNGNLLKN